MEFKVYLVFLFIGIGLAIGDGISTLIKYKVENKKNEFIETDTNTIYRNIDAVISRHLVEIEYKLNNNGTDFLDNDVYEKIASEGIYEIYNSLSDNLKKMCYSSITDDEIIAYIGLSLNQYLTKKMKEINFNRKNYE